MGDKGEGGVKYLKKMSDWPGSLLDIVAFFFSFSGTKKTTLCNNKRLARTWLDEFEILYNFTLSSVSLKEDCGIPEKMLKIKKELKCKPFHWYLQNVYPELAVSI